MSWTCPKCERELKNENQRHYCAKVSLDSLFKGRPAELTLVFDKLLAEVAEWDNIVISTTPNCIVFVHNKTFLVIRPMKAALDVKFYSAEKLEGKPIVKSTLSNGKFEDHIRLSATDELTPLVFAYINQSYRLL